VSVANPQKNAMMNGHSHSMQPHHIAKPTKKVENLPRTGTEYPLMKERRVFVTAHKEFEPLSDQVVPSYVVDDYSKNDAERAAAPMGQYPVIYDCIEPSPFYADSPSEPFIEEKDAIELPPVSDQTEGLVNEPYQKKYFFNPYNPPYLLEKPYCAQPSGQADAKLYDKRGVPRINRYYEKLKQFYRLTDTVNDKTLIFESRFESGNLKRAVKV